MSEAFVVIPFSRESEARKIINDNLGRNFSLSFNGYWHVITSSEPTWLLRAAIQDLIKAGFEADAEVVNTADRDAVGLNITNP